VAATIVQCVATDAGAGSTALNVTISATTAGNSIIVIIGPEERAVTSVTDNKGGGSSTYTEVAGTVNQSAAPGCFYTLNCAAGITQVTVNGTSQPYIAFVMEVSGLLTASAEDAHVWATGALGTTWSSGATATLAQANEFCIGVACSRGSSNCHFAETGGGFAAITGTGITSGHHGNTTDGDDLFVCTKSVTATTAVTASGTSDNVTTNAGVVTFKEVVNNFWRFDSGAFV
jgi:hypothetical protein